MGVSVSWRCFKASTEKCDCVLDISAMASLLTCTAFNVKYFSFHSLDILSKFFHVRSQCKKYMYMEETDCINADRDRLLQ